MSGWIDLHLHLDGSLSEAAVRRLAAMQRLSLPENLHQLLTVDENCRDLNQYLTKFDFPLSLLQTEEALTFAARNLLAELHAEGLLYAEIRFAPQLHCRSGLTQEKAVAAVVRGFAGSPLPAGLILCCMRGNGNEKENLETVELAAHCLGRGVVGLDLAGAEALYPTENFAGVFARARALNLPFTIHAGEAAGPESVWKALEFGARRIGHGVRAAEDPDLMRELADRGVPLELCPTSNLQTGIFRRLEDFPLRKLMDAGIRVTVNTDNRTVSGTTIGREWALLRQTFALSAAEIRLILGQTAEAVFAGDRVKQSLKQAIAAGDD